MKSLLSLPPPPTLLTDRTDLPYFYTSCVHHGAFCPSKHIFFFFQIYDGVKSDAHVVKTILRILNFYLFLGW